VIANAEGEASRFRQISIEYARAPAVTRERLYLEAMQQIFTNTTKLLVDQKAGGNLLLLPLDKILQMSGGGGTTPLDSQDKPVTGATDQQAPASTTVDPRSRDAFRSRDRESRP